MSSLHPQNGFYRLIDIEVRPVGGAWKHVDGDEMMSEHLVPGKEYQIRATPIPRLNFGIGIKGQTIETPPRKPLALHD